VAEPVSLARVYFGAASSSTVAADGQLVSYPDYSSLHGDTAAFESVSAVFPTAITLGEGRDAQRLDAELVTREYFHTLHVHAILGRTFDTVEAPALGSDLVVVVSHGFWVRSLGAKADVVGKTILLSGLRYTVRGLVNKCVNGVRRRADLGANG
jgi:hypothetical protein